MLTYINASEINDVESWRVAVNNAVPFETVAITGSNDLLRKMWKNSKFGISEDVPDLFIACVDYGETLYDAHDYLYFAVRNMAVWEIFRQWTRADLNYRHSKSPFTSKLFREFIDTERYCSEVSYVVFKKETMTASLSLADKQAE